MATALTFKSESGDFYTYVSHDAATEEQIKQELSEQWWISEPLYLESYASHELDRETVYRIVDGFTL